MALCSYVLHISVVLGEASRGSFLLFFLIKCILVQFRGDCTSSNEDLGCMCHSTTTLSMLAILKSQMRASNE